MNFEMMIAQQGIAMRDGRYVATMDQLQALCNAAAREMPSDASLAYAYLIETGCTQVHAAKQYGISQPALAQYIKRGKLVRPDARTVQR